MRKYEQECLLQHCTIKTLETKVNARPQGSDQIALAYPHHQTITAV